MGAPIVVQVSVDSDELRKWANWHADRGHYGVSHTLYQAAQGVESLTEQALREARASAFDEGAEEGEQHGRMPSMYDPPANPYRGGDAR